MLLQIALTDAERAELKGGSDGVPSAAGLALRAKIVLAAADGGTNVELSGAARGGDRSTIRKWRNRFAQLSYATGYWTSLDRPGHG